MQDTLPVVLGPSEIQSSRLVGQLKKKVTDEAKEKDILFVIFKRALQASIQLIIKKLNILAFQLLMKILSRKDYKKADQRAMVVEVQESDKDEVKKINREPWTTYI